jgi:agmatine/peptidylarginine deiminase
MLTHLAPSARLILLIPQDEREDQAVEWLLSHGLHPGGAVELLDLAVDTAWVRDYGPLQTTDADGRIIWLDSDYSSRPEDDIVPRKLAKRFDVPLELLPEGIEGGAIVSNGSGLCVSTVEAFDANAITTNDSDATDALLGQIGCQALALVPALAEEKTKHADMFVQFLEPDTAAVASFDPMAAPRDAARMDEAVGLLRQAASQLGMSLNIIRIPHPAPAEDTYASYINGLRVGDTFLIPEYSSVDLADEARAYEAFAEHLPNLRLVPIASDDIIELNGAVHCVTLGLDLPRTRLASSAWKRPPPGRSALTRQPQLSLRTR